MAGVQGACVSGVHTEDVEVLRKFFHEGITLHKSEEAYDPATDGLAPVAGFQNLENYCTRTAKKVGVEFHADFTQAINRVVFIANATGDGDEAYIGVKGGSGNVEKMHGEWVLPTPGDRDNTLLFHAHRQTIPAGSAWEDVVKAAKKKDPTKTGNLKKYIMGHGEYEIEKKVGGVTVEKQNVPAIIFPFAQSFSFSQKLLKMAKEGVRFQPAIVGAFVRQIDEDHFLDLVRLVNELYSKDGTEKVEIDVTDPRFVFFSMTDYKRKGRGAHWKGPVKELMELLKKDEVMQKHLGTESDLVATTPEECNKLAKERQDIPGIEDCEGKAYCWVAQGAEGQFKMVWTISEAQAADEGTMQYVFYAQDGLGKGCGTQMPLTEWNSEKVEGKKTMDELVSRGLYTPYAGMNLQDLNYLKGLDELTAENNFGKPKQSGRQAATVIARMMQSTVAVQTSAETEVNIFGDSHPVSMRDYVSEYLEQVVKKDAVGFNPPGEPQVWLNGIYSKHGRNMLKDHSHERRLVDSIVPTNDSSDESSDSHGWKCAEAFCPTIAKWWSQCQFPSQK